MGSSRIWLCEPPRSWHHNFVIVSELKTVSWSRMDRGVELVKNRLLRMAKALRQADLPFAVVGGNAVALWVSRVDEAAVRNTRDVDVLLRREDFQRVRDCLESAGFVYRQTAAPGKAGTMDVFLDGPGAKIRDAVHVVWANEKVRPESIEPSPDVTEAEDIGDFYLIHLDALVRMKLTSFRDKDRMHLRDLIAIGLVDLSWTAQIPPPLAERLQLILDDPEG